MPYPPSHLPPHLFPPLWPCSQYAELCPYSLQHFINAYLKRDEGDVATTFNVHEASASADLAAAIAALRVDCAWSETDFELRAIADTFGARVMKISATPSIDDGDVHVPSGDSGDGTDPAQPDMLLVHYAGLHWRAGFPFDGTGPYAPSEAWQAPTVDTHVRILSPDSSGSQHEAKITDVMLRVDERGSRRLLHQAVATDDSSNAEYHYFPDMSWEWVSDNRGSGDSTGGARQLSDYKSGGGRMQKLGTMPKRPLQGCQSSFNLPSVWKARGQWMLHGISYRDTRTGRHGLSQLERVLHCMRDNPSCYANMEAKLPGDAPGWFLITPKTLDEHMAHVICNKAYGLLEDDWLALHGGARDPCKQQPKERFVWVHDIIKVWEPESRMVSPLQGHTRGRDGLLYCAAKGRSHPRPQILQH